MPDLEETHSNENAVVNNNNIDISTSLNTDNTLQTYNTNNAGAS